MKICKACGLEKPLSEFFGPYTDKQTGQHKWKGTCKACLAKREAPDGQTKHDLARERRLRDYPGSKVCKTCGEEKPLADFGQPHRQERAGGQIGLVFNAHCLPCKAKARQTRKAESSA